MRKGAQTRAVGYCAAEKNTKLYNLLNKILVHVIHLPKQLLKIIKNLKKIAKLWLDNESSLQFFPWIPFR